MPRSPQNRKIRRAASPSSASAPVPSVIQTPSRSFGQIVKDGLGFGIGQAVAHTMVNSVMGIKKPEVEENERPKVEKERLCKQELIAFQVCLINHEYLCGTEQAAYSSCIRKE